MTNFDDDVKDLERVISWLEKEYGYRIHLRELPLLSSLSAQANAIAQSSGILEVRLVLSCSFFGS